MNTTIILVTLSALISLAGFSLYLRDTLKGKTKPNRVSFLLWSSAPLISTGAALSAGASIWPTIRVFLGGLVPLLIFLASFLNDQSYWQLKRFDYLCGLFSLAALVAWLLVDHPELAVLLAASADGLAVLPTFKKAWSHPETETGAAFVTSLISVLIILPTIEVWDIPNAAFQIYLVFASLFLVIAVYRKHIPFLSRI